MKVALLSITPNAEETIENAGRTAYLSFEKRVGHTEKSFIRMIIRKEHFSVLEHAYASFRIKGGSRSFTHQLVRHRLCSFTQQSQRFVDERRLRFIEPHAIKKNKKAHIIFSNFLNTSKKVYAKLLKLGIKNEDARFVLTNAVDSEIVITANFREWRHIIELRGSPEAQWEIRGILIKILQILKKYSPTVFEDFIVDEKDKIIKKNKCLS